jgi:hypothetical protein
VRQLVADGAEVVAELPTAEPDLRDSISALAQGPLLHEHILTQAIGRSRDAGSESTELDAR